MECPGLARHQDVGTMTTGGEEEGEEDGRQELARGKEKEPLISGVLQLQLPGRGLSKHSFS